jgi:hypothetical protein
MLKVVWTAIGTHVPRGGGGRGGGGGFWWSGLAVHTCVRVEFTAQLVDGFGTMATETTTCTTNIIRQSVAFRGVLTMNSAVNFGCEVDGTIRTSHPH